MQYKPGTAMSHARFVDLGKIVQLMLRQGTCVEEGWKSPGPVSGVGQVVKESPGQAKQC